MAKLPSLKYVKFVRAKGKVYAYFDTGRKVAGKTVWGKLPPYSSPGFFDSYTSFLSARTKAKNQPYTVAECAKAFEDSEDFKRLSQGTQRLYTSTLKRIVEQLGKFPLDAVERRHVREVVDNRLAGNGARNIFLAVTSVLYRYARQRDLTDKEPTKDIKPFKLGEHEPWPDELLEAGLQAEDDRTRLAIHLLYFTGQRIGDVVRMRWADIRNGAISVTQQKTGKIMRIPLHSALEAELNRTRKQGVTIITNWRGQPMRQCIIRKELKAFAADLGFEIVPHGLRKNAVNSLLQAGCTIAETASITGQTFKVVEHYARRVDQGVLAQAAIIKFDRKAEKYSESA